MSPPCETQTGWLDAEEQKAWRAWLYSCLLLQDRLDRELTHETGISHAYYEILVPLSETPGRVMRMSELADRCLVLPQPALARRVPAGGARLGAPRRSAPRTAAASSPSSPTRASPRWRRPRRCTSTRSGRWSSTG